jgi:hypothetical protein
VAALACLPAFEPNIHSHPDELQQVVVDSVAAVQDAVFWDSDAPTLSGMMAESANSEGTRVRPNKSVGLAGDNEIHRDAFVCLGKESPPEDKVFELFVADFKSTLLVCCCQVLERPDVRQEAGPVGQRRMRDGTAPRAIQELLWCNAFPR